MNAINSISEVPQQNFILSVRCLILDRSDQILLLRRSSTDTDKPDLWELPGGKLNQGESLLGALTREVKEKTSLKLLAFFPNRFLSCLRPTDDDPLRRYALKVYVAKKFKGHVKISPDHSSYRWVDPARLLELGLTPETRLSAQALLLVKAD